MALATTTLSAAVAVSDNSLTVASATGISAGGYFKIDSEICQVTKSYVSGTTIPVKRGQDGTATGAHVSSANVTFYLASDETAQTGQTLVQFPIGAIPRPIVSYSALGAITLPTPGSDMIAIINGTSALAMTLANPTKDLDGCILYILGNGKAAHTVTYTAGLGNGGSNLDLNTFAAGGQQSLPLIAANGIWVPLQSVMAGTLTNITITAS